MKAAVVVLGTVGWLAALAIIAVWWGTRRPPALSFGPDSTLAGRLRTVATRGAGTLVGSLVAGVLVMGLGGRLMMRVLADTSSEAAQGAITDMDAVVGRASLAGSVGFVVFVGAGAGVIGWLVRLVLRRWMPDRSVLAGLVGAGIGSGLVARGSSLLEPDNIDFVILSPAWLAVGMIIALIVTFGLTLAVLSDRLGAWWQEPTSPAQWLRLAPLGALVLVPPLAGVLAMVAFVRAWIGSVQRLSWTGPVDRFAPRATALAAAAGAAWTLAGAVEILTA